MESRQTVIWCHHSAYPETRTPHTLFLIPHDFKPSTSEAREALQARVFEPVFGTTDHQTQFLQFLSRMAA
mgnify:CR=1 FL=1